MSSCCDTNQEPENNSTERNEKEPTGILRKFLWKIGKADEQKSQAQHQDENGCC